MTAMRSFMERAFPLCRSITGDGVRATLDLIELELAEVANAAGDRYRWERHEVPTGTPVLDWTVPKEWNLTRATLDGPDGRVLDSEDSNLHVVSYSCPVDAEMTFDELRPHLHALADRPDAVPYRTSYYNETWGLCLSQRTLDGLGPGTYRVRIDATLEPGHLSYGEALLAGGSDDEILVTTHVCHPSMANDNLSGIAAVTEAARRLATSGRPLRHGLRLLFIPGTIGSITWLARNREGVGRIRAGLVLAGAGDRAPATYKRSRRGDARIDQVMGRLVAGAGGEVIDYYPYGYDERQFCSPGFDLPVGRLSRSMHGTYPEYHTSDDDLDFVDDATLDDTVSLIVEAIDALDGEVRYVNTEPYGEPQLGRRGLYGSVGGAIGSKSDEMAVLWLLAYSDGEHSLADIEALSDLPADALGPAADALEAAGLLRRA
jgi:aminopeptidase-like protein